MSKLKCFQLNHELIILSYQTSEIENIEAIEEPHGNAKNKENASAFRPITHSSRKNLEEVLSTESTIAPRHFVSNIEQNHSSILEETNTSPNIQQVYNYRKKVNRENENPDPYLELIRNLLDPEENDPNHYFNVLDETQPFVREVSC